MNDIDQYGQNRTMGQGEQPKILTSALCRAARGFLDWTQSDLADRSGVSRSTIRDYEGDRHDVHRATEAQLRLAFENGGLEFLSIEEDNVAICARKAKTSSGSNGPA
jgi:transcriptional regulator with XRE-family HTH domain